MMPYASFSMFSIFLLMSAPVFLNWLSIHPYAFEFTSACMNMCLYIHACTCLRTCINVYGSIKRIVTNNHYTLRMEQNCLNMNMIKGFEKLEK